MILSSVLAILWALCGLIATLSMLTMLGGKVASTARPALRWVHRIFGGVFTIGYVVFGIVMIPKYQSNAPLLPSPFVLHAYLGAALLPLLIVKHLVVRIFKKYYVALPYLGIAILVAAFALVALTGGHYALLAAKGPGVSVQSGSGQRQVSVALGRDLLASKCSRCHSLQPTYIYRKVEAEWRNTVKRMMQHDPPLTTSDQADHIVGYLVAELGEETEQ